MNVKERFLNYVVIDSGSSETTGTHPSTEKQWDMARLLEKELKEMGAENVRVSPTCYVYAEIPANVPDQPAIGLIAHMDTAPAVPTGPVHPRCLVYAGGELDVGNGVVMKPEEFECLKRHVGHELIVTDGTTLLGGDDKAGIAEIMTLCELLMTNPDLKHGKICVGFTPDEEIGEGADDFDVKGFGADFAYTVDGGGGRIRVRKLQRLLRAGGGQGLQHPPRQRQGQDEERQQDRHGVQRHAARRRVPRAHGGPGGFLSPVRDAGR